ncbi:MAG TPA: hypothetical protein VD862_00210 [Candidatus Paceibacterota bacterium]|nr:hypothetical protein [Candidatus Paceibacterota bacterium]
MTLSRLYTRIVGIGFLFVALSLVSDYAQFGFRPETMHKVFHVLLGLAIIRWGWNSTAWWRTFPVVNGAFFSFVALFGWLFPDFGMLDAFNQLDTILHFIVGVSGLSVALLDRRR